MNYLLLVSILIAIVIAPSVVFAQEISVSETQQIRLDNPDGITPDNPFHFFDLLFDNIFLGIQTNDVDRAKVAIKIAEERLTELKIMLSEKRFDLAERAQIQHDRFLTAAEEAITRIDLADARIEAMEKLEIERDVEQHRENVRRVSDDLEIQVDRRTDFNPEQIERIRILLDNVDDKVESLSIRIDNEKEEVELKLAEQTGETTQAIQRDIEMLEQTVDREHLDINVEFEVDTAVVEAEIDGQMQTFEISSLDAETIVKELSDLTGIIEAEIREAIHIEDQQRENSLDSIKELQFLGRK